MGVIIVEGVDGSGKTTLLRRLREQSDRYFWVASSSHRPRTLDQLLEVMHWVGQSAYLKLPVICDRFPLISEGIYGPILRQHSLLDDFNLRQQEIATSLLLEGLDRVIYCNPPRTEIVKNLSSSKVPQLLGVIEQLEELLAGYKVAMDTLRGQKVPVYLYDYTTDKRRLDDIFFGEL